MRKFLILLLLVVVAVAGAWHFGLLDRFRGQPQASAEQKGQQGARRGGAGPISVVVASATQADVPIRQRSFGYVEPEQTVAVRSRVTSQLTQQHFKEGQMVKKGDLLFTLDDRELAAQVEKDEATLAKDQALQTRTQADLSRYQQLLARNAGTAQQLDQATADAKSASATVMADQAALDSDKIRLSYAKIYAPITGRAGSVNVTPGNLVSTSDSSPALVTLTSVDPIRVTFTLPERELSALQTAMAAAAPVPVHALIGDQEIATGKLVFIDSSVDTQAGTITAKGLFDNPDMKLWPGKYVDVALDTAVHKGAVLAPAVAVQQGQKGPYVYVAQDGKAELRNVKTGVSSGDRIEIVDGLAKGEQVVIDGQLRLTNGSAIAVKTGSDATKVSQAEQANVNAPRAKD
jgi:multidrug efflux system membrane fusion protein